MYLQIKYLALLLPFLLQSCGEAPAYSAQKVNPILGDESYEHYFGSLPTAETDEQLRLQTHLAYVEEQLRAKDVSHWSESRQAQRLKMLDLLQEYRLAGAFPKNYDYPGERKPCFMDRDGNICAVGYLVAQTAGWEAAQAINEKYQYENLLAMNDATLDQWVAQSGLNKRECAMIQPTYGNPDGQVINYSDIKPAYGISSSAAMGLNLSLSTLNALNFNNTNSSSLLPWMSVVGGIGQVALGLSQLPGTREDNLGWNSVSYVNTGQRNLSYMNIGLGTATAVLGTWNLFSKKRKQKAVKWSLRSYHLPDNTMGLGLGMTKRL